MTGDTSSFFIVIMCIGVIQTVEGKQSTKGLVILLICDSNVCFSWFETEALKWVCYTLEVEKRSKSC